MEVLGARKGGMEGKMEVSVMELYYSAKYCFCEYEKGVVCGKVANNLKFKVVCFDKFCLKNIY